MQDTVVFISPAFPKNGGNGLSMRAAVTLKLLSLIAGKVHLIVIPIYETEETLSPELAAYCKSWQKINAPQTASVASASLRAPDGFLQEALAAGLKAPAEFLLHNPAWQNKIDRAIEGLHPDLLVVFRFQTAQFVLTSFGEQLPIFLDLDELESNSRQRLMQIYELSGDSARSAEMKNAAQTYCFLERTHLPRFERLFVSSEPEKLFAMQAAKTEKVHVLPNSFPQVVFKPLREPDGKFRLLLVGSFGYYPNLDALNYFCSEILPLIRARSNVPVELDLVGTGLPNLNLPDGVQIHGDVSNTEDFYSTCDVAIVPLRAAGGTRIKILEAFSNGRPIVSTSIGAEGLSVQNGLHLMLADTPESFADACIELANDKDRRQSLAQNGHELFLEQYSLDRLESLAWRLFC